MKTIRTLLWTFALLAFSPQLTASMDKMAPAEVDGAKTIDVATAKKLWDEGAIFVDVRPDKDWEAGRIPGALHLDVESALNETSLLKELKKDQVVVMYCNGVKCHRSSKACAKAVGWGFTKVHYFRGGMPDWKSAGHPVE